MHNFVRRVVDDTLDRTVTFCEQPRHAITALENICTRAWPQLEVKRHRNRIRAYLKACRRNSKKNKGQINMKEPPANGLSIEARQLVSKALTLVAGDLDYLKQTMQVEKAKNDSLFPSKVDSSSEKSYSASSSKRSPNHHLKVDYSTTINNSELTDVYYNQKYDPYEMNIIIKIYGINNNNINSYSSLSSSSTTSPFIPSSILPTSPRLLLHNDSMKDASINISSNSNAYDVKHDKLSIQNKHSTRKFNSHDSAYCLPPPAHIGSIHYSPLTNQILDRLMDTTLLTHNDIEFFLQNLELTKIAIKQARCQSYLILKKIEIVENHLHTTSTNSIMMPLNLS
ncbi:Nucleolar protein [Schistosoma japonicum]|nr:Nucleolar protein [Schistosoma japonicum]